MDRMNSEKLTVGNNEFTQIIHIIMGQYFK